MSDYLAVLTSDWHLSDNPPVARSAEPDWFAAMKRSVDQIKSLRKKYTCPIIHAGDLFDRHSPTPNLINWCLENLPAMYAVPGNHELPLHRYEDRKKSAFWTLVIEGRVTPLEPGEAREINKVRMYGFPWGHEIDPATYSSDGIDIHLAVVHRYVWMKGNEHPGATMDQHVSHLHKELHTNGYTHAVVGDNHCGFLSMEDGTTVFNCGSLMKRKADEYYYRPWVGLLRTDGVIEPHYLDCSEDKWVDQPLASEARVMEDSNLNDFLRELNVTDQCALTFAGALEQYMNSHKVSDRTRKIILTALEKE